MIRVLSIYQRPVSEISLTSRPFKMGSHIAQKVWPISLRSSKQIPGNNNKTRWHDTCCKSEYIKKGGHQVSCDELVLTSRPVDPALNGNVVLWCWGCIIFIPWLKRWWVPPSRHSFSTTPVTISFIPLLFLLWCSIWNVSKLTSSLAFHKNATTWYCFRNFGMCTVNRRYAGYMAR